MFGGNHDNFDWGLVLLVALDAQDLEAHALGSAVRLEWGKGGQ
jgi:hypothetical protein